MITGWRAQVRVRRIVLERKLDRLLRRAAARALHGGELADDMLDAIAETRRRIGALDMITRELEAESEL